LCRGYECRGCARKNRAILEVIRPTICIGRNIRGEAQMTGTKSAAQIPSFRKLDGPYPRPSHLATRHKATDHLVYTMAFPIRAWLELGQTSHTGNLTCQRGSIGQHIPYAIHDNRFQNKRGPKTSGTLSAFIINLLARRSPAATLSYQLRRHSPGMSGLYPAHPRTSRTQADPARRRGGGAPIAKGM